MNIKGFILKNIKQLNGKYVYIQTNKVDMIQHLYQDLVNSGFKPIYHSAFSNETFFIFSDAVNSKRFDIRNEIYFNNIPYGNYTENQYKFIVYVDDDTVLLNYDFIVRYNKINNLKKLCLVQYPKIEKFTKENVYFCHVPHEPSKFFYDEVYNKGILRKEDLEIGKYYYGKCRNASVARWDGEYFTHMRTKFNNKFPEEINHLQDDDGYDLFIPIEKVIPTDDEKII